MPTGDIIGIEDTLLMLDDTTPYVAVPVQTICDVVARTIHNKLNGFGVDHV